MTYITSTLKYFGLSDTEARVYEAGIRQGETDIATLSRVLGMNRATTYHNIHALERRGLVYKRVENGRLVVTMAREEGLQSLFNFEEAKFKERKENMQELLKRLPEKKRITQVPDVQYFSGDEGVKMALEIAYRTKSRHWDIIAPRNNFFSEIDEEYAAYYLTERKKRKISSRSIWEKTSENARLNQEIVRERNPRYLPKSHNSPFRAVLILFDTRALFISSAKEKQAMLINSSDVCSTLQMQFDVLWQVCETPTVK